MTSASTSHDACRATGGENAGDLVASVPREQRAGAAGVALVLAPISRAEAQAFIALHHRHHKPHVGEEFCLAACSGDRVVAVAAVGRPVARGNDNGWTLEVTRLASDGTRNACSFLYGAAWRAAKALGYKRLITYTLPEEGGASLRASGWHRRGGRRFVVAQVAPARRYASNAGEDAMGGGMSETMRGAAWALADVLTAGCGGVAEVPAATSDDDVRELEALGVEVRRSARVRVATWTGVQRELVEENPVRGAEA